MQKIWQQIDYDVILQQSEDEKWGFIPTLCPWCLNGAVAYGDDDEEGNRYEQSTTCTCSWCHKKWQEDID